MADAIALRASLLAIEPPVRINRESVHQILSEPLDDPGGHGDWYLAWCCWVRREMHVAPGAVLAAAVMATTGAVLDTLGIASAAFETIDGIGCEVYVCDVEGICAQVRGSGQDRLRARPQPGIHSAHWFVVRSHQGDFGSRRIGVGEQVWSPTVICVNQRFSDERRLTDGRCELGMQRIGVLVGPSNSQRADGKLAFAGGV